MTKPYPVMLSVEGKRAVVIGGGQVASRKIKSLIAAGAKITVISPNLTRRIEDWVKEGIVTWKNRLYVTGDEAGAIIVIAATNDSELNALIARQAEDWQLVNVASSVELGNFYSPAQVNRGKLMITVATEGASPLLTKRIQRQINEAFPEDYGTYVDFLAMCREQLKQIDLPEEQKHQILKKLLDPMYQNIDNQKAALKDFTLFVSEFPYK